MRRSRFLSTLAIFLLVAVLLGPLGVSAVVLAAPAAPIVVTITQPDGVTTFQARAWGDEYLNGVETVDGYTILKDPASGIWYYAEANLQTKQLELTDKVAGRDRPPAAAQYARPETSAVVQVQAQYAVASGPIGVSSAPVLVILANYTDRASVGSTEADFVNLFFGATNSVSDYYQEVSYGKFGVTQAAETCGTANNGVTNWLNIGAKHPNLGEDTTGGPAIAAAALQAANGCVNYAAFDLNDDHVLAPDELLVVVVVAGYEAAYGPTPLTPNLWGHQNTTTTGSLDGVTSFSYGMFGEWHASSDDSPGHRATIGIMVHELGHLLGWPDLYDGDDSSQGVGRWSVMGSGSWLGTTSGDTPAHPSAWEKWYQSWLTPRFVNTTVWNTAIPRVEDNSVNSVIQLGSNPNGVDWRFKENPGTGEYFLIENRQQTGYDARLPGCGLLIWHIDETRSQENDANTNDARRLVDLEEADGSDDLDDPDPTPPPPPTPVPPLNQGDAGDPYPGSSNNTAFTNATYPNSNFYGGLANYLSVTNISPACANTKTADISAITTYVAGWYSGPGESGDLSTPFNTITEGVNAVPNGGTVGIYPGNYSETMVLDRPMVLRSTTGTVVIGR